MTSTLFHAFLRQVETRRGQLALIAPAEKKEDGLRSLTWAELADEVGRLASAIERRTQSLDSETRVVFPHRNRLADVCISLAASAVGAVEVPLDARQPRSEIASLRRRVDGLWLDEDFWQRAQAEFRTHRPYISEASAVSYLHHLHRGVNGDRPALLLWTSGTTGQRKGVLLSHRNLLGNAAAKLQAVPQSTSDVRLTVLPLSHAYARTCDLGTWLLSGCTLAITLGMRGWNAMSAAVAPTLANVVPSVASQLLQQTPQPGQRRLRLLGCGGAALNEEAFARFRERGVTVIQGYGLTETSPVICSATPEDARPGYVGRPVAGWQTRIAEGRLFVRGPHLMLGYFRDAEATAEKIDRDGWLDTGDLVEQEEATGQIRIIGRADDLLVLANGTKLHPREIERVAEEIPAIARAMVVLRGQQLELWYETVQPTAPVDDRIEAQLITQLSHVPSWKRPQAIYRFSPALSADCGELNFKGAIRRHEIWRRRFAAHTGS